MGRTIPSFRIALMMEQAEWKSFRNNLDRSQRKKFDRMFDIPRLYISCCAAVANPVLIQPIVMSIIFHHFKQLDWLVERVEKLSGECHDSIPT
jgi:hypothetical protein